MYYQVKVTVKVKGRKFAPRIFEFWTDAACWIIELADTYAEELLKVRMRY
jgi:hypothetical protein